MRKITIDVNGEKMVFTPAEFFTFIRVGNSITLELVKGYTFKGFGVYKRRGLYYVIDIVTGRGLTLYPQPTMTRAVKDVFSDIGLMKRYSAYVDTDSYVAQAGKLIIEMKKYNESQKGVK